MIRAGEQSIGRYGFYVAGMMVAASALTACTSTSKEVKPESTTSAEVSAAVTPLHSAIARVASLMVKANYQYYRSDGKCDNATPRPCAVPIYKKPAAKSPVYTTDVENAFTPSGNAIAWPKEGQPLTIVCQVQGLTNAQNTLGNHSSIYNVIKVPADSNHVNQATLAEAQAEYTDWKSVQGAGGIISRLVDNGTTASVYGYVTALWENNGEIYSQLGSCTPEENPAHAHAVTSK